MTYAAACLTGKYDLTLKYDPTPPSNDGQTEPELAGPSIFTVIQEQLGLTLQSGTTVPVEYFIVDHLERPPES